MNPTNRHTAARQALADRGETYTEAKKRLSARRSFVQNIAAEQLRKIAHSDAPVTVGHYPEETH